MPLVGHFLFELLLRRRLVDYLFSLVGLAYPAERYRAALYRNDTPAQGQQMAKTQSGCGLTCEDGLAHINVDAVVLHQPYAPRAIGKGLPAVAWQEDFARHHGAWVDTTRVDPATFEPPRPGDMWRQGRGNGKTADPAWYRGSQARYEHVGTVAGETSDGLYFPSIEGGKPGIELCERRLVITPGGELWICNADVGLDASGRPLKGARVAGYINIALLPLVDDGEG